MFFQAIRDGKRLVTIYWIDAILRSERKLKAPWRAFHLPRSLRYLPAKEVGVLIYSKVIEIMLVHRLLRRPDFRCSSVSTLEKYAFKLEPYIPPIFHAKILFLSAKNWKVKSTLELWNGPFLLSTFNGSMMLHLE